MNRSSLCRAKDKLDPEAFLQCLQDASDKLSKKSLWKGHVVRAIDGTHLLLPSSKSVLDSFPVKPMTYYPNGLLLTATNVFTGQPSHATLDSFQGSERDLLLELAPSFNRQDVLLLDRGFEGRPVFCSLHDQELFFIARLRDGTFGAKSCKKDQIIEVLHKETKYKFRIIKHRRLILVTNLLGKKYPRQDLLDLYKKRWEAETLYHRSKQYFHVETWHTKKAQGVIQEVFANLLAISLVAGSMFRARFKDAIRKCNFKNAMFVFEKCILTSASLWGLTDKLRLCYLKPQPGRSYPRYSKQPQNKWIQMRRPSKMGQAEYSLSGGS